MPKPETVIAQVAAPRENFPGAVTYGYFSVEGNKPTMTDGEGTAVRQRGGDPVQRTLTAGDNPPSIAASMTRELRLE